jgi:hypothetical protein
LPTQSASSRYTCPVDAHRPFPIYSAGEYTFYFNAKVFSGGGNNDSFYNLQMTAIYFPTAYGSMNLTPPLQSDNESGFDRDTAKSGD